MRCEETVLTLFDSDRAQDAVSSDAVQGACRACAALHARRRYREQRPRFGRQEEALCKLGRCGEIWASRGLRRGRGERGEERAVASQLRAGPAAVSLRGQWRGERQPLVSSSSPRLSSPRLSSPLLSSRFVSSPLLSSPRLSSRLLSSPLVSSLLLSSPLLSYPLLSSPTLSYPLLPSPLLSSPLLPHLLSARLLSSPLVSSPLLSSPLHSSLLSSSLLSPPLSRVARKGAAARVVGLGPRASGYGGIA